MERGGIREKVGGHSGHSIYIRFLDPEGIMAMMSEEVKEGEGGGRGVGRG